MARLQEYDRNRASGFSFREDMHMYFCNRSPDEYWPKMLHAIPVWCVVYPLLVIVFVSAVLYFEKGIRHMLSYAVSALGAGICAYAICILAWDLDRFYFCIFMSVFLISAFVVQRYLAGIRFRKRYAYMAIALVFVIIGISGNRFLLFDGVQYNESIRSFWTVVAGRIA